MAVLGIDLRASRKKPSSIAILDSQSHLTELASFFEDNELIKVVNDINPDVVCLLYTSPSPRDRTRSRMPSSA